MQATDNKNGNGTATLNPVLTPEAERLLALKGSRAPKAKRNAKPASNGNGVRFQPGVGIVNPEQEREKSGKRTPRSMKPAISNQTKSTPNDVDFNGLVETTARRKASIGSTFSGNKGKQPLFAAVCAGYKSLMGIDPKAHVDTGTEGKIREAIAAYWRTHADRILNYGRIVSATYDKPKAVWNESGEVERVELNAQLKAVRDTKDAAEARLNTLYLLNAAKKRLVFMDENPGKFEREEVRAQQAKISALERMLVKLTPAAAVDTIANGSNGNGKPAK